MLIVVPLLKLIVLAITNAIGFTKKKKGKVLGLVLGFVNYAIFFVALFVPLYNLANLASDISGELIENKEQINLPEDVSTSLEYVKDLSTESFVNNAVVKPFNKLFNKNIYPKYVSLFGNPLQLNVEGQKINLVAEYNNLKQLIPVIVSLQQSGFITEEAIDLTKISNEDLEVIKTVLNNTKLINTLLPAAIEIVGFKQKDNPALEGLDIDALVNANWEGEMGNIYSIFDVLKDNKFVISKAEFDYMQDSFISFVKETILIVANSDIVTTNLVPWGVDVYLTKYEETEGHVFEFNKDAFINADWKVELQAVADAFYALATSYKELDFDVDNWKASLYNVNFESCIKSIVDACLQSNLLKDELVPQLITGFLEKALSDPRFDFIKEIVTENETINLLKNQLHNLVQVIKDLDKLKVFEGEFDITPDMSDDLTNLLTDIFELDLIKGHEELIINKTIDLAGVRPTLDEYGIVLHFDKVTSYKEEIINIKDFVMKFMAITDMDFNNLLKPDSTERENVGDLIDSMYACNLVNDNVFNLVEKIFGDNGFTITFTEEERALFDNKQTTFKAELLHILSLYDMYQIESAKGSYENFDPSIIYDITMKASEKVLSTKIFCLALNTAFGSELGINLQTSKDLADSANLLKDAINMAQLLDGSLDLSNPEETKNLVDTMKSLGNNDAAIDIASQAIDSALGVELDCSKDDILDAADTIDSVISSYQASADQENFDASDLTEEQINSIKNNKLTKKITELLLNIVL